MQMHRTPRWRSGFIWNTIGAASVICDVSGKHMLRIYCDFNDAIDETRYSLNCAGSLEDIRRFGSQLRDGLRVVLYQTGELEAEGTIHKDPKWGWVAEPDWSTKKFLDETPNR